MLGDGKFRGYYAMLIKLKTVPVHMKKWFERCPCHEVLLTSVVGGRRHRRKRLILDGLKAGICMFMSCRIWEFIDNGIEEIFGRLKRHTLSELVAILEAMKDDGVCSSPLTDSDIQLILDDFERACQHYMLGFAVKLSWTRAFPWVIMVLCHPVETKAWELAVRILKKYEEHSGPLDRRTEKFLNPASPLRRMWEEFIATKEMPPILRFEVSLYRFVPLSDRPIEAEHVFLKDQPMPGTPLDASTNLSSDPPQKREWVTIYSLIPGQGMVPNKRKD